MCICNDRRWPETYRVLGLRGAEMILLGYNTPACHPEHPELDRLAHFHNQLSMQAGAYQNGCWVVGVAKGSGDGYWYLVRGVNCKGKGTYNSGGAAQIGLRDGEIAASGSDCP